MCSYGDIYTAALEKRTKSSIQTGFRPVLIVSNNRANRFSPVVTIIPITGSRNKKKIPTHVHLTDCGLNRPSIALAEQITSIDKSRLIHKLGTIRGTDYEKQIGDAVEIQLNLQNKKMYEKAQKDRKKEEETMAKIYFTLTGTGHYFGDVFLKEGVKLELEKEPDNKYDKEAIMVKMKGLGKIGYVANSSFTVIGESMSAGRLYDKIGEKAEGKVALVTERGVLCKVCKKSLEKQSEQVCDGK